MSAPSYVDSLKLWDSTMGASVSVVAISNSVRPELHQCEVVGLFGVTPSNFCIATGKRATCSLAGCLGGNGERDLSARRNYSRTVAYPSEFYNLIIPTTTTNKES